MYNYRLKSGEDQLVPNKLYRVNKDGTECAYLYDIAGDKIRKIGWIPAKENFDWDRTPYVLYDPANNKVCHDSGIGNAYAEVDTSTEYYYQNNYISGIENSSNTINPCNEIPIHTFPPHEFTNPKKKETMLDNIIATNKAAATQAAYLEAGRLANVTMADIIARKFPGLPQTPFNALVIANLADVISKQIKPSPKLQKITGAMVTQAYTEVYQLIDLEGMIGELIGTVGSTFEVVE